MPGIGWNDARCSSGPGRQPVSSSASHAAVATPSSPTSTMPPGSSQPHSSVANRCCRIISARSCSSSTASVRRCSRITWCSNRRPWGRLNVNEHGPYPGVEGPFITEDGPSQFRSGLLGHVPTLPVVLIEGTQVLPDAVAVFGSPNGRVVPALPPSTGSRSLRAPCRLSLIPPRLAGPSSRARRTIHPAGSALPQLLQLTQSAWTTP